MCESEVGFGWGEEVETCEVDLSWDGERIEDEGFDEAGDGEVGRGAEVVVHSELEREEDTKRKRVRSSFETEEEERERTRLT